MKFLTFFMLLYSIALTYARAVTQDWVDLVPGDACDNLQANGSVHPDYLPGAKNGNVSFAVKPTAVSDYKTVIPDLTALGYTWDEGDYVWYLGYEDFAVDALSAPDSSQGSHEIEVSFAYNGDFDTNPHKLPLRDILLSYWKYKEGKAVKELECILYENVIEVHMRTVIPEIYPLLGQSISDDMKNKAVVELSPKATGGEKTAYTRLLDRCPFPTGTKKMLAEYAEFMGRQLGNFEIRWMGGSSLDFAVYFRK